MTKSFGKFRVRRCQDLQVFNLTDLFDSFLSFDEIQYCMDGKAFGATDRIEALKIDDDDFKIKGAAARTQDKRKKTAHGSPEPCTICLEPISERAVASPCNHLSFDFLCLVSWLQERSVCPLCNTSVDQVQYNFCGPEDYETYHVPRREMKDQAESAFERSRRRRGQDFITRRSERRPAESTSSEDPTLERRRLVYRHQLYSLHVGANRLSQYRDFTAEGFSASVELQRRARIFLRRELQIFSFLNTAAAPRGGNLEFLLEYIVAILKTNELKGASGHAEDLLTDYVGRANAKLLLHELEAWLRSPFTSLMEWDSQVQYTNRNSFTGSKTLHG
jgi:hypothetical protein